MKPPFLSSHCDWNFFISQKKILNLLRNPPEFVQVGDKIECSVAGIILFPLPAYV